MRANDPKPKRNNTIRRNRDELDEVISDDSFRTSSEDEEEGINLRRRIETHLKMYRYENVEPRYMNSSGSLTKDMDEYFVNL